MSYTPSILVNAEGLKRAVKECFSLNVEDITTPDFYEYLEKHKIGVEDIDEDTNATLLKFLNVNGVHSVFFRGEKFYWFNSNYSREAIAITNFCSENSVEHITEY